MISCYKLTDDDEWYSIRIVLKVDFVIKDPMI